jgi:hypothetical protein
MPHLEGVNLRIEEATQLRATLAKAIATARVRPMRRKKLQKFFKAKNKKTKAKKLKLKSTLKFSHQLTSP